MTSHELQDLLTVAGVTARVRGGEVLIESCLFCGNAKWNLELNVDKGVYHAWCCRSGGRLEQLLFTLTGVQRHVPVNVGVKTTRRAMPAPTAFKSRTIADTPSAASYLSERGIDAATAAAYGLCVCVEQDHALDGRIAIPARDFWTGTVLGWLGRAYVGQRPKYISTLDRACITGWRWPSRRAPVVVVEGHLDGIAVHRAGASAAVLSGLGDPGIEDWAARLPPEAKVAVMLDGEAQNEAARLYWRIAAVRTTPPMVVQLAGGQDPASLGPDAVRELVGRFSLTGGT